MTENGAHDEAALAGATVIVTGGARGIGERYARAFAGRGAHVVIADRLRDAGEALARELGATFAATDVADEASVQAMAAAAAERTGRIDVLVNNAAIYADLGGKQRFDEISVDDWDRVMAVNVRGPWLCARAVYPHMREHGGRIVNVASVVAHIGTAGFAHYVASKAAVMGLTRALAREVGSDGITVNAVAPGLVANESSRVLNEGAYLEQAARVRAVPRDMAPEDLVGAVLFLSSPASGFMSGQTLVVDGGGVMP
jgi:NAD(P)-dependent dehydrogenase (short-subunit alcohol dehydrogenase family)